MPPRGAGAAQCGEDARAAYSMTIFRWFSHTKQSSYLNSSHLAQANADVARQGDLSADSPSLRLS